MTGHTRRWTRLLAVAALLAAGALPARAGTAEEPEVRDPCGPGSGEALPGWLDVCAAWFSPLTGVEGPPGVRLTARLAGDVHAATDARYELSFVSGPCRFVVRYAPGSESRGILFEPEHTVQVVCLEDSWTARLPVEQVDVTGDLLSVALFLSDRQQRVAEPRLGPGNVLRDLAVTTSHRVALTAPGCPVSPCATGDTTAPGRPWTVPAAGPGSARDAVRCPVPASEASAERPHLRDPAGDVAAPALPYRPAADVVATWVAPDGDGHTVTVLPAGPGAGDVQARYIVRYDRDRYLQAGPRRDGTWLFTHGVVRSRSLLGGMINEEQGQLRGTVDPATGAVTVRLPADAGTDGVVLLQAVYSSTAAVATAGPSSVVAYAPGDDSRLEDGCEVVLR